MSENTEPTPAEPSPSGDEQLGEAGLKALQREREARKALEKQLSELKPLAEKWTQAEEAQKSELERARDEAAKAIAEAKAARAEALRYRIANRHGISDEDAAVFLTASDEAGLETQAARLAEIAAAKSEADRRAPDPSQGPRPPVPEDPWAEGKARARARFGSE